MSILAVDIGAGTQDILLFNESMPLEGSFKMVLPSFTVMLAGWIDRARIDRRPVFLKGPTMGGGAITRAVRRHIEAGLDVYATKTAALSLNDDLTRVEGMGVLIGDDAPAGAVVLETGDLRLDLISQSFGLFGIEMPEVVAVAVQDHGYSPGRSNRQARFEQMAEMMRKGGLFEDFAYREPPAFFSRMAAVSTCLREKDTPSFVMDTGPAAILGATLDPRYREPALVVNIGNGHTIAAVVQDGRMVSLFEHHTSLLDVGRIGVLAKALCEGTLSNEAVFADGGHGAHVEEAVGIDRLQSVLVTGPRRHKLLSGLSDLGDPISAAPGGDMMIAGSLGLVEAWRRRGDEEWR